MTLLRKQSLLRILVTLVLQRRATLVIRAILVTLALQRRATRVILATRALPAIRVILATRALPAIHATLAIRVTQVPLIHGLVTRAALATRAILALPKANLLAGK